jgi:hypothetical protein
MNTVPDHSKWRYRDIASPARIEKIPYPFLTAKFYRTVIDGKEWSSGLFFMDDTPIMTAWGLVESEHCSNHAVMVNGTWSPVQIGCPNATPITANDSIVGVTFLVDGKELAFKPSS